ncbi:PREDICTED: single-stranded DNA-binding protein, mitochondrial [Nicotiana attenuata]|uniref:Single-stranded dna-binding protein, mitochondrial n=1 Tax=Nicotiana attenuata TaxID=49451 RepID=A0A1J6I498_NICAT|nr:PREDICTED: single-stranded DNA-binding protein, mitochondrial [Nicotiana attenuata]OIS99861.1 single-stranded dna-binding protein, mitochondrial [Nicotiana attenuata]
MNSMAAKIVKFLRVSPATTPCSSLVMGVQGSSRLCYSTGTFLSDDDGPVSNKEAIEIDDDDFLPAKPDLQLQSVDPRKGWNFRGVHKAIICGRVGQSPVQKILRNGRTVTIFTVGTGGMFDQRITGDRNLPKPGQWHRVAVHNDMLGQYSVQQLTKNSSVYIEGDIETRVYNDSLSGEVKSIPEICVRRDGRIRLIKGGESVSSISIDELREGLL